MSDADNIRETLEQLREHGFHVSEAAARDCITVSREGRGLMLELRPHGSVVNVLDPHAERVIPIPVNRIMRWVEDRFSRRQDNA